MSKFDRDKVRQLAKISLKPSRGRRESFLPFDNDQPGLRRALQRAERAYNKSLQQQSIIDQHVELKSIFQEEKRFSVVLSRMIRTWKGMTELARKDIAATADYLLAIEQCGDYEELLVRRARKNAEVVVAKFESILAAMHRAAVLNGQAALIDEPSRKKGQLANKNPAPLREFTYQLKLHWDRTMSSSFGPEFDSKFAFTIAREFVFEAVSVLTKNYTKLDVKRIIRSVQTSNYDPKQFRASLPGGLKTLDILRPELSHWLGRPVEPSR